MDKAFLFLCLLTSIAQGATWLRQDEQALLPRSIAKQVSEFKTFPAFYWNFLRVKTESVSQVCEGFKANPEVWRLTSCPEVSKEAQAIGSSWAQDWIFRSSPPTAKAWREGLGSALGRASLPLSHDMTAMLRVDPFEQYRDLLARKRKLGSWGGISPTEGKLEGTGLSWIAVQPAFSPAASEPASVFQSLFSLKEVAGGFGPHFSAWENRTQLEKDLTRVSWIGTLSFALLIGLAFYWGQARFLFLSIPVFGGVALALGLLVWAQGSVHGLTLSFGTGIIGMAFDYGFHAAFSPKDPAVWRSNWAALVTSLIVFAVLAFSELPLIRELMLFSMIGLSLAYGALYLLFRIRPICLPAFRTQLFKKTWVTWFLWILILGNVGFWLSPLKMSIGAMNYESAATLSARTAFQREGKVLPPLFMITPTSALKEMEGKEKVLQEAGIPVESWSSYLGSEAENQRYLSQWSQAACESRLTVPKTDSITAELFAPFLSKVSCDAIRQAKLPDPTSPPAYVAHLSQSGKWLGLYFASSQEEERKVHAVFPEARSLKEWVDEVPVLLAKEARWMVPLSFGLILLFLWVHARSFKEAAVALSPFLISTGSVGICYALGWFSFSFVSLIALIILCGFSVDYGVFAMEAIKRGELACRQVGSALFWAGASTVVGFLPLVFCEHPVLRQLGEPLLVGSVVTLAASYWAVPVLVKRGKG